MSHNFPTSTLREGVTAHNDPLLVWDLDTCKWDNCYSRLHTAFKNVD